MKLVLMVASIVFAANAFAETPRNCPFTFNKVPPTQIKLSDAKEIAELIYKSQTACHGRERADSLKQLATKYNPDQNPEIMTAAVLATNDAHEIVRYEAIELMRKFIAQDPAKCRAEIKDALTAASADCDDNVLEDAKATLKLCPGE